MKQIIKRIISDFHRQQPLKIIPRHRRIPIHLEKIITIIGPRRAGKTCFLFQIMNELMNSGVSKQQILYINFEDERLNMEGEYDQIIEAYLELYPDADISRSYFFFDEIQELKHWETFVRRMYDTRTRHIFLTGSSARLLSKEIASSLRGRSISYEVMPLSFKEYLKFRNTDYRDRFSTRNISAINSAFDEYLLWGGYPEIVGMDSQLKLRVLQEYFNVMLYRDLAERYGIRDVSTLKYLIKRMISSFTKEFSIHKIYNNLKSKGISVSKTMIYQMSDHIFSIYMMAYLEKYDPSLVKREMSNKKLYLYDNGLASVSNYIFFEDRGKLLENMVFSHLRRETEDIFFLKNGWECDFLVCMPGRKATLIQVTESLDSNTIQREVRGLDHARKKVADHADTDCLILTEMISPHIRIPDGIHVKILRDWLIGEEDA